MRRQAPRIPRTTQDLVFSNKITCADNMRDPPRTQRPRPPNAGRLPNSDHLTPFACAVRLVRDARGCASVSSETHVASLALIDTCAKTIRFTDSFHEMHVV